MFYKVVKDPIRSFFDDEEDDHFATGMERSVDFNPFRIPVGVFAVGGGPQRRKQLQRQTSLKRKQSGCNCDCQGETEISESTSSSNGQKNCKSEKEVIAVPESKKTKFEIKLNIDQSYKPGELKVKLDNDNRSLVVEGSHQETQKGESGFSKISTLLYHKFSLPKDVDVEGLTCDLNEKGLMVISAPRKLPALEEQQERLIPITHDKNSTVQQVQNANQSKGNASKSIDQSKACHGLENDNDQEDAEH